MAQKNMRRVCFDTFGVKVGSSQADNTSIATNSIRDIRYKDEQPSERYMIKFSNRAGGV